MNIIYYECVSVALVIHHAMCMRQGVLSFVACLALEYFSTLSYRRNDFKKIVTAHKMCILILFTTFVRNILRRIERNMRIIINMYKYSYKGPVILVRF